MSFESMLRRKGVSRGAVAKITRAAKQYIKDGASVRDAQITAVRDHSEELRARKQEIEKLASADEQ